MQVHQFTAVSLGPMARTRTVLGLVAGAFLLLSAAAHSLLGWNQLQGELAKANVPADLAFGLKVGWQFGGVAMVVLGVIVLHLFLRRLRGEDVSTLPGLVIAVAYLTFGGWALAASEMEPFFFVFVVPGVLLLIASWHGTGTSTRSS